MSVTAFLTERDADVVDSFLKYLDRIAKLYPAFSYEHAEAAEPKELAAKVLSIIANKNVFIGICTIKEKVIGTEFLSSSFLSQTYVKEKVNQFESKTSD